MPKETISSLTKKHISATNRPTSKQTKTTATVSLRHSKLMARLGHLLASTSVVVASLLATSSSDLPKVMESQAQTVFYLLRGAVVPPEDIVILAIDEKSISIPQEYYRTDPQKYANLEPLKAFPFKREAYAKVIDKLMKAGARSVALDVVFDTPSRYGETDDRRLQRALRVFAGKVTLAASYNDSEIYQGQINKLNEPQPLFWTNPVSVGLVNFPLEVDGKIQKLGNEYIKSLADTDDALVVDIPSFDEATLKAAKVNYLPPKGNRIYFYGPTGTFKMISFMDVLEPENWNTYLQQGKVFKNKVVIIGATDKLQKDYFPVPASTSWLSSQEMSGVEIHANAIATLMEGQAISQAIENPIGCGLFVFGLVGGCSVIIARKKPGITRFFLSVALAISWGGISYALFLYGQLIFPTAVPVVAITVIGLCYLGTEVVREILRKSQLVKIFQKYASHQVVQEILSQQDDLRDLLQQREMALSGKILEGRYKIVRVLGSGGFSETYVAEDMKLPDNPLCVVKQLKPANTKSEQLVIARRLFNSEAKTLYKLGTNNQIPQLFAYFEEEEEFYLVQEYIVGHALSQELPTGKRLQQAKVIEILKDLLQTLTFVHHNGVIHRDIKPNNIIRRDSDSKLVLIDFGAVKEVTTQLLNNPEQTAFTIGIGTRGYAPSEQYYGRPQYSSDIYAVGMIAIKALTGIAPHEIERDASGELKWVDKADVSDALAKILSKMVLEDFQQRYQSASLALEELNELINYQDTKSLSNNGLLINTLSVEYDSDTPTTPWVEVSEETSQWPSSTSILPPRL
ncbi:MAG: serine/threonine-protein kinase [Rhizonema sp. PD37]|nr:serine/threonine-protein kinase [Rhizonema sp. PD37]